MIKKIKQLVIIIAIFALVLPTVIFAANTPTPSLPPILISGTVTIDNNLASNGTVSVVGVIANIQNDGTYSIIIPYENNNKELIFKVGNNEIKKTVTGPTQTINLAFTTAEQDPDPTPNPSPSSSSHSGGSSGGDSTPPTNTSIIINNDEETTVLADVILTLSAGGAKQMMIANDSNFKNANWENYTTTKKWTLTKGNGEKTVYVKFKDTAGNISKAVQDLIILSNTDQTTIPVIPKPIVKGVETDYRSIQLEKIINEAGYIWKGNAETTSANMNTNRDSDAENNGYNKYTVALINDIDGLEQSNIYAITNFVVYGTETTKILGAGECAGVINSYKSAFGKLPTTESEWQDVIKIANGRWPNEKSKTAEVNAKIEFKKVYKREADMENPNDNAAVTIISYGLRSDVRNLDSEKAGILTFKHIDGYNPSSATDWDIVRAIAYSGAVR